ncbi:DNA-binding response regulator [Anaerocolumna cellulosilytica]|uniref:Stage 0 sporulation protein A homolog n=1 Tax=Anaerocolumna cellulosilytica TaxID=433286 RepID=A0A6S6R1M0_9FIRM|nr:response regulator transcription factor [Anaerocolumna cellulosilytica]MBB5195453.1 DNA-binding response OmpR family regulator [Anaerocolumna cellulosilytica]BCJ95986.1 DNA-binding response regulator [Anaerocolumna cellulosilytica]
MYEILIIEDDKALSNGIRLALQREDLHFMQVNNLFEARNELNRTQYDLILLDINLPDGNGFIFLEEIRCLMQVPIIILTACDMETDIVTGLELGADDYITKPFSLMILRARVNTQLKRGTVPKDNNFIQMDEFRFDFDTMEFFKRGEVLNLSRIEQKLLKVLVFNKGRTLTRNQLMDKLWMEEAPDEYQKKYCGTAKGGRVISDFYWHHSCQGNLSPSGFLEEIGRKVIYSIL